MNSKRMFLVWGAIIVCGVAAVLYVREHRLRTATVRDLIRAVHARDKGEIEAILKRRPELVNARNADGLTALYLVCGPPGPVDMAEFLIEKGADVNVRMRNKETALVMAVESSRPEIVKLLLSRGADPDVEKGGEHVLFEAAQWGQKDIMKLLVEHGADVNARNREGQTILFYDLVFKDDDFLKTVLKKGIDVGVRDDDGMSAVEKAMQYKCTRAVETLREHGATTETAEK